MLEKIQLFIEMTWNQKNPTLIDEIFHPQVKIFSFLGHKEGIAAVYENFEQVIKAFPDFNVRIFQLFANGNSVICQWEACGTHRGKFNELAPTGKVIEYGGVTLFKIAESKIIEKRVYTDFRRPSMQLKKLA